MNDPIVEEIRKFRQEHTDRFDGNLEAICGDLRKLQQTCGRPVVTFQPKRHQSREHSSVELRNLKKAAA